MTSDIFHKTKPCPYLERGFCWNSEKCSFAHGPEELRPVPCLVKTKICVKFMKGLCKDKETCPFAHGVVELKEAGDGCFKTSLCNFYKRGKCLAGIHCRHAHGFEELRHSTKTVETPPKKTLSLWNTLNLDASKVSTNASFRLSDSFDFPNVNKCISNETFTPPGVNPETNPPPGFNPSALTPPVFASPGFTPPEGFAPPRGFAPPGFEEWDDDSFLKSIMQCAISDFDEFPTTNNKSPSRKSSINTCSGSSQSDSSELFYSPNIFKYEMF
eukprot:GHVL01010590.1.p1 GENE.GHVL01010590.1~~GHVL01010590.1.p1  ORF type:complete len:271 (+),score=70.61 GHVL01010590.1:122-934(+)